MLFGEYNELIINIILSMICGGLIGAERERKHRPAGIKTHVLVCIGAMSVMYVSKESFEYYFNEYGVVSDPNRLGAQIINGIGFLGAGTIIRSGSNVKGLTTAATIWTSGIIGMVIGTGLYIEAIIISVSLFAILVVFNTLSRRVKRKSNIWEIDITGKQNKNVICAINAQLLNKNIKIHSTDVEDCEEADKIIIHIVIEILDKTTKVSSIVKELEEIEDVIQSEVVM